MPDDAVKVSARIEEPQSQSGQQCKGLWHEEHTTRIEDHNILFVTAPIQYQGYYEIRIFCWAKPDFAAKVSAIT